ncbi:MAG: heavy metal translocating P-type ATPase, partial [Bacilli bacterium]|nr:heavy metal translocating P-type ATPase [Bacilli bacterium]
MEKFKLKNLDCVNCAIKIEDNVRKMEEVKFVNVDFANLTLTIDTYNIKKVISKIKEIEPKVEVLENNKDNNVSELSEHRPPIIKVVSALLILLIGIIFEKSLYNTPFHFAEYFVFVIAYIIVGWKVIAEALRNILKGQFFNEYFLMTIATLGAFAIDAMAEAVSVMLFYVVGELFQDIAVGRSRKSIKSLLEIKPNYANLLINGDVKIVLPDDINVGDLIIVKAGEKIPIDGEIIEGSSFLDTSALTGESIPRKVKENDSVLSGMINQNGLLKIKV